MLKFIIDIFCKDTIIGLSQFEDVRSRRIYKNRHESLFSSSNSFSRTRNFTDPIACHL